MAKTAIRRRVKKNKNKSRKNKRRTMRYMGGDGEIPKFFKKVNYGKGIVNYPNFRYYTFPDNSNETIVVNFKKDVIEEKKKILSENDANNADKIKDMTYDNFIITDEELEKAYEISNGNKLQQSDKYEEIKAFTKKMTGARIYADASKVSDIVRLVYHAVFPDPK